VTGLRRHAEQYLVLRRSLGFKLVEFEKLLMQFLDYLESTGASRITTEVAVTWARLPAGAEPAWWRRRLSVVSLFARHLHSLDPTHQVPPARLLRYWRRRISPHLYSEVEIDALLQAAGGFRQPLRAATYRTVIGLLTVTGLRIGELVRLDRADVDLDDGVLTVRDSKFGKSRRVLLHPTTVAALRDYARVRDGAVGAHGSPAFFVSTRGRLLVNTLDYTFAALVKSAGITTRPGGCNPRLHDFRHSFAVATLLAWYRAGVDVQARVPLLSTWLGHVDPSSTYWYLQAAPELLALAAARLEHPIPRGALSWPDSPRRWRRSSPTT
jgi:integrase/recombinase XerD